MLQVSCKLEKLQVSMHFGNNVAISMHVTKLILQVLCKFKKIHASYNKSCHFHASNKNDVSSMQVS